VAARQEELMNRIFIYISEKKGYRNVSVIEAGFSNWIKQKYRTEAEGR